MKIDKKSTWQHQVTGVEGNVNLFGVNIFDYKWVDTHNKVKICDPIYHQEFNFSIYEVEINGDNYSFAAGEFSNLVWGFYV